MAKVFLNSGESFTLANSAEVYGAAGTGTEKVLLTGAATGITTDQNIERVELSGNVSAYTFQVVGNQVKVYSGTTLVTTIGVQGDADGTKVAFADGSADLKITGLNAATLGGQAVSSASATAITGATLNATDKSATAGSTSTTPGVGQAFTLTTSTTDAPALTTGSDTITGAAGTIQDTDRLIDTSTSDNDIANLTLNTTTAKPQIVSVETLNITGEYTTTGFDFTNAVSVKTANFAAGITNAAVTASKVAATRVAEIKAGANVGTLTVSSDASGTGTAVKVDTGSATSIVIGGFATGVKVDGNDIYDITLGSAATSLTLEANANGGAQSTADAFTVKLAGNTLTTFNTDAGEIETLTINSSGAANTLTLTNASGELLVGTATGNKAVITGDKNLTLIADLDNVTGVTIEDTSTATTTLKTTSTAVANSTVALNKVTVDVVEVSVNQGNVGLTLNENSTLKLSVDNIMTAAGSLAYNIGNVAGTLATPGTLKADVTKGQTLLRTGDKVATLDLTANTDAVTIANLNLNEATGTVKLSGSKDVGITLLADSGTSDDTVITAATLTGKLKIGDTTADKFVIVGGSGNDDISIATAKEGTVVRGGAGNDKITGATLASILSGDAGNDSINGGDGKDTISGGDGDDVITGGKELDIITGGAGADKFVINTDVQSSTGAKADYITDFVGGTDKIMLTSNDATAVAALADLRTLAAADQAKVNAATDVAAAATQAFLSVGAAYKAASTGVVIFNYNADTYAVIETDTVATFGDAADYLVKITGVTGTLAATDFLVS